MDNTLLNQDEPLIKERSYTKSIMAGMRLPLRHPWGFLRHLWPTLLLCMLVWAVIGLLLAHYLLLNPIDASVSAPNTAAVQHMALQMAGIGLAFLAAFFILPLLVNSLFAGQLSYLMTRYGELGYLPAVAPWKVWRDILPYCLRSLCLYLVGIMLMKILLFAMLALAIFIHKWAVVPAAVCYAFWLIYYVQVSVQILIGQQSPRKAIVYPFRHWNQWGNTIAIMLVCGILGGILSMVGWMPGIVSFSALTEASTATMQGDAIDLPSSFHWLLALAFALGALVHYVAWLFMLVPLTFHWGSQQNENNA